MADDDRLNRRGQKTVRQRIHLHLQQGPQDVRGLSRQLKISEKDILAHLKHVSLSARQQGQKLIVTPSICCKCGFTFKTRQRLTKPSRCPNCHGTYLTSPAYEIK